MRSTLFGRTMMTTSSHASKRMSSNGVWYSVAKYSKRTSVLMVAMMFFLSFVTILIRVVFHGRGTSSSAVYDLRRMSSSSSSSSSSADDDDDENEYDSLRSFSSSSCNDDEDDDGEIVIEKSWIFETNQKRLGYTHMATIHPIKNGKVLLAAWQGAHRVEGTDDQSLFVAKSVDGGKTFGRAKVVPGRTFGVRWAPTFFSEDVVVEENSYRNNGLMRKRKKRTYLFFAESERCWHCESQECEDIVRKRKAGIEDEHVSFYWDESRSGIVSKAKKAASVGPWWRPGGNIKRILIHVEDDVDDGNRKYSNDDDDDDEWIFEKNASDIKEEMILEENEGSIPKVIGNPPLKTKNAILLPFWREHPRADAKCQPRKSGDYASVMRSTDNGSTFHETNAKIEHSKNKMKDGKPDWLIEGSIVGPLRDGRLAQFFRTSRGAVYVSHSSDNGETWDAPRATPLQNPNSKVSALLLPNGVIVVCHNAHAFMKHPRIGVTRGKLALSTSADDGRTWKEAVLFIEDSLEPGKHVHYPTIVLDKCVLRVSYSVSGEGVKLATVKNWVNLHSSAHHVDEQRVVF